MDKMNDRGMIGIDLMVAIVLVFAAVMLAILIMPNLSHEDRSWRNRQYMTAVRASDNLVRGEGEAGWVGNWTPPDYAGVTKIGFVDDSSKPNVLNETKIIALMGQGYPDSGTGLPWWEFPQNFTSSTKAERINATQALGLAGYNFYMQLHPVRLNDSFNLTSLWTNLTNRSLVPINDDTASAVDRYVYIKDDYSVTGYLSYRENLTVGNNRTVHYRLNLWVW